MRQQTTWIRLENFVPCLELLAHIGETELDETSRTAFEGSIGNTEFDADQWFDLPLGTLNVGIAREDGGKVFMCVEAPHGFARAVDAVTFACASYHLRSLA